MVSKRKISPTADDDSDDSAWEGFSGGNALSDDEVDISSALTGKQDAKRRKQDVDEDADLQEMIQQSIAKRNVKGGTEAVKKAKGKGKMAKGEVGGGSFQSMGASRLSRAYFGNKTYLRQVYIRLYCVH